MIQNKREERQELSKEILIKNHERPLKPLFSQNIISI